MAVVPRRNHKRVPLPKIRWILELFLRGIFHLHHCPASFCATSNFQVEKIPGGLYNSWMKFLSKTSFRLYAFPLPIKCWRLNSCPGKGVKVRMHFHFCEMIAQIGWFFTPIFCSLLLVCLFAKYFEDWMYLHFPSLHFAHFYSPLQWPHGLSAICHCSFILMYSAVSRNLRLSLIFIR